MMIKEDRDYLVIETMERYGGSFVQALALAFAKADVHNYERLRTAFPDIWDKYSKMLGEIK